jgi:hypothetical protein
MTDVTQILNAIEQGDPSAAEQLLPLIYDELRKLAAQRMAQEKPGQTLQATALVHEAYLRLVDTDSAHAHLNDLDDLRSRLRSFCSESVSTQRIPTRRPGSNPPPCQPPRGLVRPLSPRKAKRRMSSS